MFKNKLTFTFILFLLIIPYFFLYSVEAATLGPGETLSTGATESMISIKKEHTKTALDFINLLSKNNTKIAHALFDKTMAKLISPEKLENLWDSMLLSCGSFSKILFSKTKKEGLLHITESTTHFEKADLKIRVVTDSKKRVTGLNFLPVSNSSKSDANKKKPEYSLPDYAVTSAFTSQEILIDQTIDVVPKSIKKDSIQNKLMSTPLPGTLYIPKKAFIKNGSSQKIIPSIILVHGSGQHDRDETIGPNKPFKDIATGLASNGIAVLTYEKRTKHCASQFVESPELVKSLTFMEETVYDAIAALKFLDEFSDKNKLISKKNIHVLGHSLGGFAIPGISKYLKELCKKNKSTLKCAGYILMAGNSRPLEKLIYEQYEHIINIDNKIDDHEKKILLKIKKSCQIVATNKLTMDTPATQLPLGMPAAYWMALKKYDPIKEVAQIESPLLFLQGERDYQVTLEDFELWKKAPKKANAKFYSFDKLNHLFISGEGPCLPDEYSKPGHVDIRVIKCIANWIKKGS